MTTRVRFTQANLGACDPDNPYRFSPHVVPVGATGCISTEEHHLPHWDYVVLDQALEDGATLVPCTSDNYEVIR